MKIFKAKIIGEDKEIKSVSLQRQVLKVWSEEPATNYILIVCVVVDIHSKCIELLL